MSKLRWIIWDLGGVVINLDIANTVLDAAEKFNIDKASVLNAMREEFLEDPDKYSLTERAVLGRIERDIYLSGLEAVFKKRVPKPEIYQLLCHILKGQNDSTVQLIQKLKKSEIQQACMSNIDKIHWDHILSFGNISDLFDFHFLSFREHLVKPHLSAYNSLLKKLDIQATDCLFVDDRITNVKAARSIGIDAIHYQGHSNLLDELSIRNIIVE